MVLKQNAYIEEIEKLKNHQVHQHDLQTKLRISEKTRLELLSSLCESEAAIKKLKIDSMRLQEEQHNSIIRERQLIEDNDKMWTSRLKLLQDNFEKDKQSMLLKFEKEQQMHSEKEKLRELMHRSNVEVLQSSSDLENSALPATIPTRQSFQSVTVTTKQGDYQATKKPRTTTPNTSRKMPTNSLHIAAVNSIKNHISKHPDDESQDFAPERVVPITQESMSWNQVTNFVCLAKQLLIYPASFKKSART
jgi:hypothetical protein